MDDFYTDVERSLWAPIMRAADRAVDQGEHLLSVYARIGRRIEDEISAPADGATILESDPYVLA
jgi:hypothetical protein